MMSSVALIGLVVILEARPVYTYLTALRCQELPPGDLTCLGYELPQLSQMVVGFGLAAVLCAAGTFVPIRVALRKLEAS